MSESHVRFTPKSGHCLSASGCPLCAISGHRCPYTRAASECIFAIELPAEHAVFREIKGSLGALGGRAILNKSISMREHLLHLRKVFKLVEMKVFKLVEITS